MGNNELAQIRICLDGKLGYLRRLGEDKLLIDEATVTDLTFNSVEGHRLHTELIFDPQSHEPKSLFIYLRNTTVCVKEDDEFILRKQKANVAKLTFRTFAEQRDYKGLMFDFRQREVEFTRIYFKGWLCFELNNDEENFADLGFGATGDRVGYIEVMSETRSHKIETIRVCFDGKRECVLVSEKARKLARYMAILNGVNVSLGDKVHIELKFSPQGFMYETFVFLTLSRT